MNAKTLWRRTLVTLGLVGLTLGALPAAAQEEGTRVSIRLSGSAEQLPEAEKLVASLEAVGGEHQVRVMRRQSEGQTELTLELWGKTVPAADIPRSLREAFPALASADIQVAALPAGSRPSLDEHDDGAPSEPGVKRVKRVRKVIQTQ